MSALDIADCINETCPWSGKPVQADSLTEYDGRVVGFCNTVAGTSSTTQSATSRRRRRRGDRAVVTPRRCGADTRERRRLGQAGRIVHLNRRYHQMNREAWRDPR